MSSVQSAIELLLDQNLSVRLAKRLSDIFPGGSHVSLVGLDRATDWKVWEYARENGYMIVTKDADFNAMNLLRGCPPKIIWIRLGNCTTNNIEQTLRRGHTQISDFAADDTVGILELV